MEGLKDVLELLNMMKEKIDKNQENMEEKMDKNQESIKESMKEEINKSQEGITQRLEKEINKSREGISGITQQLESLKTVQEDMRSAQEEIKNELKEEMKQQLLEQRKQVSEVADKLRSEMDTKFEDVTFEIETVKQKVEEIGCRSGKEFQEILEKLSEKYGLQDITFGTFTLQYGYRNKYCALDFVLALLAILEASPKEKKSDELFNLALDCLSKTKKDVVDNAIERAKTVTKTLFKTVQSALDMKQIIFAGPFVYYIIQEGSLDWYMFSHPHILLLLAHFVLRAYVTMSRNRKASSIPLIVSAPKNVDAGSCILLGIPPLCENSPKNFFGKAFEQAAERINCDASCNFFDTSCYEIHVKDRTRFFDALTALLS